MTTASQKQIDASKDAQAGRKTADVTDTKQTGKIVRDLKVTGLDWDQEHGEHVLVFEDGGRRNVTQQFFNEHGVKVGGTFTTDDAGTDGWKK